MVSYRSQSEAAEETAQLVRKGGGEAITFAADMGDPEAVQAMIETTRGRLGPIDLLVNNAAYTHLLNHEELTFQRWQRFMRTNLDGPFLTMWAAKQDMAAAGGGAIVNVSSLGGINPRPDMIGYGASKAGLNQLTRATGNGRGDRQPGRVLAVRRRLLHHRQCRHRRRRAKLMEEIRANSRDSHDIEPIDKFVRGDCFAEVTTAAFGDG
jgi:NAD(P)-dependent dehydrogenase (short-subunit alcohol dehydrogenase family)